MLGSKRDKSSKHTTNGNSKSYRKDSLIDNSDDDNESHDELHHNLKLKESKKQGKSSSRKNSTVKTHSDKKDIEAPKRKDSVSRTEVSSFGVGKELEAKLADRGITSLFEVQQKVFFPVFNGENVIVASLTGSGKTLSFILPLLEKCKQKQRFNGKEPAIIVLAPTRELAIQIGKEFSSLSAKNRGEGFHFKVALVYGGTCLDEQKALLRRGCDIIVGTPGRVLDMVERKEINVGSIRFAVLDEADKMLEMGFQEPIEAIFDKIYEERPKLQVCLFSATIERWVLETSKKIMRHKEHTFINLMQNLKGRIPVGVENLAVNCLKSDKITTIADLIVCYGGMQKSTIVFVPTKRECNTLMVSEKLKSEVQIIHGDINQKQREASIEAFKAGKVKVLVATDVAARGLDIPMVDLIIQSEPPKEIDSYIHRAGRTARAGKTGTCITLYTRMTEGLLTRIEMKAKIKFKKIGAPQTSDLIKANIRDIKSKLGDIHQSSVENFLSNAEDLLTQYEPVELVSRLLAFLSGQTSEMKSRSILCGAEGFVTYQLEMSREFNSASYGWSCLRKVLSQDILSKVKGMRTFTNMKGTVFDFDESDVKEVEMSIKRYKVPNPGFVLSKCENLPDLTPSDQRNQRFGNDRNTGGNSYGNGYGNSYGNSNGNSNGNQRSMQTVRNVDIRKRKDVFMGNLPYSCDEGKVLELLGNNGINKENVEVRMVKDNETGTHKGYCFLSVYDDDKFDRIVGMPNKNMGGRLLKVEDASASIKRR